MCAVLAGLPAAFWELRKRRMEHVEAKRAEIHALEDSTDIAQKARLLRPPSSKGEDEVRAFVKRQDKPEQRG